MGPDAMILVFLKIVSSQLFYFPFSSASRGFLVPHCFLLVVLLSAYLRFLIFLLAILISVCESFSLASWCTPYKLNKQAGWQHRVFSYSFPNFESIHCSISCFNCCFMIGIQVSQETGKVVWHSHLFKNLPVCCDPHLQRSHSQWGRSRCFSGIPLLSLWSSGDWQSYLWFFCLF